MRSLLKAEECLGTRDWSCPARRDALFGEQQESPLPHSSYIGGRAVLADSAAEAPEASFQRESKVRGEAEFALDSVSVVRVAHF